MHDGVKYRYHLSKRSLMSVDTFVAAGELFWQVQERH
jgi:hypothetical protein